MKKGTKIGIGASTLLLGVLALTSCTQSFCTPTDTGRIMYAFDPGVTRYAAQGSETFEVVDSETGHKYTVKGLYSDYAVYNENRPFSFKEDPVRNLKKQDLTYLNSAVEDSRKAGYVTVDASSLDYFKAFDKEVLKEILLAALRASGEESIVRDFTTASEESDLAFAKFNRDVQFYSYRKYIEHDGAGMFGLFDTIDKRVRATATFDLDTCPSIDFTNLYKSKISGFASAYRTCLTTKEDKYGTYGLDASSVYISAKTWGYAWSRGFFEGLLVYPIGWLIDQIVSGFRSTGMAAGAAAFLGIVFITIIIRGLMLLATFKSTTNNAKMTELQPEIQKIQNKYPNSNTSQVEKQRMAEEMNRLYKKNKINPFSALLVMILQFPVFTCVWGALIGSSAITNGTVLGLRMDLGIKDVLFNAGNWTGAGNYCAVTAFFLFLFMAAAQTVSMLLPQWIQKAKAKKVAKLGKNPAQKSQNNQMKIFTYVMLALIIFMGFSLVSAMGIYWLIGAIFSVFQTLITQLIMDRKAKNRN